MSKTIAWSWTRLDTFEQCPRKFQGSYITKEFPKPDFDAEHFRKGRAIHKVLENYMLNGEAIPCPIVSGSDTWNIDLRFLHQLLNTMHEADSKHIEQKVCFDIKLNKVDWYSKKAWCRVIMDAMVIVGDYALIIDWKSGKVNRYSDQLKLFAAAAFQMFPEVNRVLTAYVWCEHPNDKPVWAEYSRDKKDFLWEEFADRAELIQMANESGNWPAKKNRFCGWCDATESMCEFKV